MDQPSDSQAVRIEKHPPERRRRKTVTTHCGCCCCCCCCLHSVGGLIGAAVGSAPVAAAREPFFVEDEENPGLYRPVEPEVVPAVGKVIGTYWLTLVLLSLVMAVTGLPWFGLKNELGIFGVLMVLPAIQAAASVVNLIIVLCSSGSRAELLQVGKIFAGTLIGTIVGIGAMWLICVGIPMFK